MKKIIHLFLIFVAFGSYAQTLINEKVYATWTGKSKNFSIDSACGQGYLLTSSNYQPSTAPFFTGAFLYVDSIGNTIWTQYAKPKQLGGDYSVKFPCFCDKNNFYFNSLKLSAGGSDTCYPVIDKFNMLGVNQFNKRYTFGFDARTNRTNLTAYTKDYDGNYLYMGTSISVSLSLLTGANGSHSLLKIDSLGNTIFYKTLFLGQFPLNYRLSSVIKASDIKKYPPHNYVIYGTNGDTGHYKPMLLKLNRKYDTIATKLLYLSLPTDNFQPTWGNMLYTHDNSFVVSGGYSKNLNWGDISIVQKLDTNLQTLWIKKMGIVGSYNNRIFELKNDTILLVTIPENTNKIWLYKIRGSDGFIVDSTFVISTLSGSNSYLGELRGAVLRGNGQLAVCGDALRNLPGGLGIFKPYFAVIQLPVGSRPAPVQVFGIEPTISSTCLGQNCTQPITCSGANCSNCFGIVCTVASTLGNLAIETQSGFTIYPNPSKGLVTVQFYNIAHSNTLQIYDAQGNKVQTYITNQKEISVELSAGFYNFVLQSANGVQSKKMLVE